jgi:uncharacterized iron-regulated membrane protein
MFQLHLWAGLILGVYIVAVCVSGSVLVFRNDIYDLFEQWIREGKVSQNTPYVQWTYVMMRWCGDLHGRLLLSAASGMQINAIGGFLTAAVCVTGLVIWWPGIARWRRALIVRSGVGWKRFNFDLHSALGFWTFLILFMWGVTGGYFVFPEPFRAVINYFTPIDAPRVATQASNQQVTPVRAGETKAPPMAQAPAGPRAAAQTSVTQASVTQKSLVQSQANAAQAAASAQSSFPPAPRRRRRPLTKGGRILQWFSFLHYGNFAGWPLKVLWTILGFAPAILFGTAVVMWWNRVLNPALLRSRRSRTSPAEWGETPVPAKLEWEQE